MDVLIILIMVIKIHNPFYAICVCVCVFISWYTLNIYNSIYQIFTILFIKYSQLYLSNIHQ